jgi:hypothetical protein
MRSIEAHLVSPAVQMDALLPSHHTTLQIEYPALTIFGIIVIQNSDDPGREQWIGVSATVCLRVASKAKW